MSFTKPKTILIIDDNSSFVLSILRSFSDNPEYKVDVLVGSTHKPNYFKYSRYIRNVYGEEPFNENNFKKIINEYIRKSSADIIIPTQEWISKLIYRHKQELEKIVKVHPMSDVNTIETLNDKWRLNNWLKENNFPFSRAEQFSNELNINKIVDHFTFPLLLKPSISQGGIGIKLINSKEDLESVLSENGHHGNNYIIQEYIYGYDIGINIFSVKGKILCHTIQKGLFQGQLTFSRGTQFIRNPVLFEITSEIVSRLKYTGVANLDFRYNSKKGTFVLVDFNARYWSTLDGSRFMGVNFPLLATKYALGIQSNYPDYSTGTYYCANEAIRTSIKNMYSRKKYPIDLLRTKLTIILKDPAPEIFHSGEQLIGIFKNAINI